MADVAERTEVRRISHWIGGKAALGASGRSGPVYNPALGVQTGEVDFATVEEVGQAVAAAKKAFPAWREVSLSRRTELMFRIRELVHDRLGDIAAILTDEHGKVLSDAKGELTRGIEVVEFACGIPHLLKGEHSINVGSSVDSYSEYSPLGVVAT